MTTILNASSSSGLVATADTSAILQLQTANTTALTVDASQNVTIAKPVALSGSTSGAITLAAPAVAGTNTITLPASTGTLALTTNGLTQGDSWFASGAGAFTTTATITSSWARSTVGGFSLLGGGMTQSSGIFTFPTTGVYLINAYVKFYRNGQSLYVQHTISGTTNNSTYNSLDNYATSHIANLSGQAYSTTNSDVLFNVTDTTQCKIKLQANCEQSCTVDSAMLNFIRISDKV